MNLLPARSRATISVDVTLIHNPSSGDENHSAERIRCRIDDAGHHLTYRSVTEQGWEDVLGEQTDLVVVVGGDGTVGDVMKQLAGRATPVAILPAGTANNIAASLGLSGRSFDELVHGWATARRLRYMLGEVETGGRSRRFVEAVGGGIIAAALERAQEFEQQETSSELGIRALRALLGEAPAEPWELEADGDDLSGHFLAVDVMIVGLTGPRLPLAPDAEPADGLLDLVTIGDAERNAFAAYLDERLSGGNPQPLSLPVRRAARVRLVPPLSVDLRLDDAHWEPDARELTVSVGPVVEVLLP
jgi:diacylglycerol kinase family enzyme